MVRPMSAPARPKPQSGKPRKVGWIEAWNRAYLGYPSVVALILANLIPLAGVLFWGWDLLTLMLVYWLETGVIGFWTILHMALVARWQALHLVPFFVIHFGGFMFGHLMLLLTFFGREWLDKINTPEDFVHHFLIARGLWVALLALFVSHGVSFYLNVLLPWWRGTAERPGQPQSVMMAPYGRVIVMHVTLLFGAALAAVFKTPTAAFVLLIALKIFIDVSAHVRKNFKPVEHGAGRVHGA